MTYIINPEQHYCPECLPVIGTNHLFQKSNKYGRKNLVKVGVHPLELVMLTDLVNLAIGQTVIRLTPQTCLVSRVWCAMVQPVPWDVCLDILPLVIAEQSVAGIVNLAGIGKENLVNAKLVILPLLCQVIQIWWSHAELTNVSDRWSLPFQQLIQNLSEQ